MKRIVALVLTVMLLGFIPLPGTQVYAEEDYQMDPAWSAAIDRFDPAWVIPDDAVQIYWTGISNSKQTHLDYVFLVDNDDGTVSLFFFASSTHKAFTSLTYDGASGDVAGHYNNYLSGGDYNDSNNSRKFFVWSVVLPEDDYNGKSLSIDITTGGGHAINGVFNAIVPEPDDPPPAELELWAAVLEKVYDGEPLEDGTVYGLPDDFTIEGVAVEGSQTEWGTSDNLFVFNVENMVSLYDENEIDVTDEYNITYTDGTLTVTQRPVTITVLNSSKALGAADPAFYGYIGAEGLVQQGDLGTLSFYRTNPADNGAGVYYNVLTAAYTANPNYAVRTINGNFSIIAPPPGPILTTTPTPAPVTATAAGGGAAGGPVPGVTVVDPPTPQAAATITDMPTPQAAVTIPAERPPLASYASWALLNLILTIVTGLIMAVLLATYFVKRKDEEEDDDPYYEEEKTNKHLWARLITIATTAVAVILFVLTQNMSLPMQMVDVWTAWHIIIATATIILAFLSRKTYEEDELEGERT